MDRSLGVAAWRPVLGAIAVAWLTMLAPASAQPVERARVEAALPRLEALAEGAVESGAAPGIAIAIVHDDDVVYLKGFGRRAVGRPEAVDPDTVFQIASLSKAISATVVAGLIGDGLVDWSTRIADLDPSFRLHDPYPSAEVTVRDLFAHISGLPGNAGNELEDIGFDRAEVLRRLRLVAPATSFRAGYSYSNAGLTAGAVAAARPTGKPWEAVAEDRLFRPLGMTATSGRHADFLARTNRAALHVRAGPDWVLGPERNPDMQSPAGGVSASVRDLAQWLRLVLAGGRRDGRQVIATSAMAEMLVPLTFRGIHPVTGGTSFYGMGWNIEIGRHGLAWGHSGAFSQGARTVGSMLPKARLGILVLSNGFPTGVPEGLADAFFDLVFDGAPATDWIATWGALFDGLFAPAVAAAKTTYGTPPRTPPAPPLALDLYVGRFKNDYVGDAVVTRAGDALRLALGPGGARFYPLRHFDRDLFLANPTPELPDYPAGVRFTIGADGKAEAVTIEWLDEVGLGTLRRTDGPP